MQRAFILLLIFCSCNTGKLKVVNDLPMSLKEVSGIETDSHDSSLWMVNDSGNKPILFKVDTKGTIIKQITIKAKNRDWEDLTTDPKGNIYIGDFGNNENNSKHLKILKVSKDSLHLNSVIPEKIKFNYPEQTKFPPKKKDRYFDCESFFFYNDSLFLFTKSRNSKHRGKTNLYKLPSKPGTYKATYINTFNTCDDLGCWVTSADINKDGSKVALLTENNVFVFSGLNSSNFFTSKVTRYNFKYDSQKESVCFKNDSTLYIADEYRGVDGGNLYEFKLKPKP